MYYKRSHEVRHEKFAPGLLNGSIADELVKTIGRAKSNLALWAEAALSAHLDELTLNE
jgi:hypothetical protein